MKRICSFCLVFTLVLSLFIPVYAQERTDKDLQEAIAAVKQSVSIPADYTLYDYDVSEEELFGKNLTVWRIDWENEKEGSAIYVYQVEGLGLVSYYHYQEEWREGMGTVKKAEGEKTALAFLSKARPDIAQHMEPVEVDSYRQDGVHHYRFQLTIKDVPVPFAFADIEVDRHTGEVTTFSCAAIHGMDEFPSLQGVISLDEGKAAYQEKIGALLNYYSAYYTEEEKAKEAFPLYLANSLKKLIDAKSGKIIALHPDMDSFSADDSSWGTYWNWSERNGGEIIAWEGEDYDVPGVMSAEKAGEYIKALVPGWVQGEESGFYLQKNGRDPEGYIWKLWAEQGEASIDAKTGELLGLVLYSWNFDEDQQAENTAEFLTEAQAKEKAETWIKSIAPEKLAASAQEKSSNHNQKIEAALSTAGEELFYIPDYTFNYYRQAGGVDYPLNGVTVDVNPHTGQITKYDCGWDTDITFAPMEDLLPQERVFTLFNETGQFGLSYIVNESGTPCLVYGFTAPVADFGIQAKTGEKLDIFGAPYVNNSVSYPVYQDIAGHRAEDVILELLDYGYYLPGEKFKPNEMITEKDFLAYLFSPWREYYEGTEFDEMINEYRSSEGGQTSSTTKLTKQEAAKYLIESLELEDLGASDKAFINPFSDQVDESYQGYVSLCYILGIMGKDNSGRFNGKQVLTRAEAAELIYRSLEKESLLQWY